MLQAMKDGGLMLPIAASHLLIGVFLLFATTRFLAGMLQLPISLGILAFHFTMMPEGIVPGLVMVILNLGVVLDPRRLRTAMRSELDV